MEDNVKHEAKEAGVHAHVYYLLNLYENIKLGIQPTDIKETDRWLYEADKQALEDIIYYKRKCLDEFFIRERIKNYEEKKKNEDQVKEKYMPIFEKIKELFG